MRASSLAFFFFQAEDGIRDLVTGVQTCALPSDPAIPVVRNVDAGVTRTAAEVKTFLLQQVASPVRSEERRVGKERSSRWAALFEEDNYLTQHSLPFDRLHRLFRNRY